MKNFFYVFLLGCCVWSAAAWGAEGKCGEVLGGESARPGHLTK